MKYIKYAFLVTFLSSCVHVHAPKRVVVQCELMEPVKLKGLASIEDAKFQCTWKFHGR